MQSKITKPLTTLYPYITWYPAKGPPTFEHLVPLYHFGATPDHPATPGYKLTYLPTLGTLIPETAVMVSREWGKQGAPTLSSLFEKYTSALSY